MAWVMPFVLHEDLAEQLAVDRVVAELAVHHARALYSARSVRADRPLMPTVRLVKQEGLQDGVRVRAGTGRR
jgi:hypothetical protein